MKNKILKYISLWEDRCYSNGIPDEVPQRIEDLNKAPSYRAIVKVIIKNDINLESLGYSRPHCELYSIMKRIELTERGVIKPETQLKLNI
jgi:predicted phosphoadenosine phosphosulfate sulfurtransferase